MSELDAAMEKALHGVLWGTPEFRRVVDNFVLAMMGKAAVGTAVVMAPFLQKWGLQAPGVTKSTAELVQLRSKTPAQLDLWLRARWKAANGADPPAGAGYEEGFWRQILIETGRKV